VGQAKKHEVIILAAGYATRLYPLTLTQPEALALKSRATDDRSRVG